MSTQKQAPLVLVIEDEPLIADLLQTALEDAGFAVAVVSDGAEALDQLAEPLRFAGVVTDINLGGPHDGWEIGRRAREQNAAAAIVYCTGLNAHEWASKGVPNSVILTKPFAPAQVVVALANMMNAPGTDTE